jgi:hypothetical protein
MIALVLALALSGEVTVEPQVTTWLELDTNAARVPDEPIEESPDEDDEGEGGDIEEYVPHDPLAPKPTLPVADGLVRGEFALAAQVREPGLILRSDSAFGVKLFATQRSERMIVGQTRATLSTSNLPGGAVLTMSAFAKGRAQVSGARTYGLLRTDSVVDKAVLDWLVLRAGASGHAFQAFDAGVFSSAGASAIGGARAQLGGAEHIDVVVDAGGRGFPFAPQDINQADDDPDRRADAVVTGIFQITSARRLYLSASYLVTRNASSTRGESFTRHRLSAVVGMRLPAEVTCTAQGALQVASYDEGVSLGQVYFLGDDNESQNVLEVKLSRPLWGGFYIEGRAAFFGNELAVEGAQLSRQTAAIGIRAVL